MAYNTYAWNTEANIIFIDQPTIVGFSYQDSGTLLVRSFVTRQSITNLIP